MNRAQRASKIRWEKPYLRTKTDDESNYPCPRSGHTLTMVGSSGFLFGGICKDPLAPCNAGESKGRPLDELHVAHIGKAEIQWCRLHLPKDLRPLARWRHSACLINETQIVIFGGHHAPNLRLNDLWIFDSISMEWTQPGVPQTPGIMSSESYSRLSQHCVPSARGGHTASVIGRYIYVFGGYGGHGYARKDHDDVHRLFVDSWTWSRVETKGKKPEKRCGHGATAVEKHLFVWGGWNASTQFSDVFVLDVGLDVPVWSSVDALPEPRWHAAACAVEATPYSKIFVFGGAAGPLNDKSNRLGAPRGDLSILDTGTLHWTVPTVSGEDRPQPRCDATLAFDTKSCKLVLFGGWSNEWLGDLYMLDVGHVVGPPYSVIDLYPSTGPVTGGFAVEIAGYDFVDSTDVVIRFASKNPDGGTVDVNGAFVSKTQLNCTAPDFSMYPTGEVQVRVAINKDSFTTTFRHFTFFPVTDAAWTLIYGPGVLSGGLCGEETTFFIQARDKHNANRTAGGDEFEVSIQQIGGRDDGEDLQLRSGVMVQDNENGCYDVSYTAPSPGEYSVEVVFLGTNRGASGAVRGSGVIVEFVEIAPRSHNSLTGKLVKVELDHDVKFITELIDKVRLRINSKPYSESFDDIQNREALASVKEHIDLLYERKMDLELAIDRAECTLEALNAAGVGIGLQRDLLKFQQEAYAACKRDAPKIEAAIAPLLRSQQTRTRDEIDKYQANVEKLVDTLRSGAYSKFSTGVTFATDMINNAMAEYEAELARHNEIVRRARLFGCMEEVRASVDLIDMAGATLCGYRDLWTCAAECEVYLKEAGELTWDEVDPKGLEDNARLILKKVHSQSKLVKRSDAYSCLEASAMDFLATCPLVASLKQPVIQARHWRQLREFVKKSLCNSASSSGGVFAEIHGEFDPETCKLREFLNLKMHLYADRINHMIDEATSEARQEETLVAIAAFWESTRFIRSRFGESTVEFLALSDDASGKLESDQVALDALITSRIGCMQEKAKEWKAKLVTVENAVILLRDVQTLWSRLEPFLNDCEEIMIDLPETSESFRELDKHVKKCLCQISAASGTVLALTCDGMIERLTETLSGLEKGQRDLGLFLNKKRRTFPRFYFICEDALLAILACGSNPKSDVIARSVPDLFPATASFRLEDDGVDIQKRPYGVGFASILGDERVAFDRMVRLVGNVEAYFKSLHVAQESALRKRFQLSLERYPKQKRSRWAQETDSKGNCIDPTQIALLVAEINYVSSAEEAMKTAVNGRHDALQEYAGRHIGDLHDLVLIARTKLTKPERTRLTSLICQDSHGRDVLQRLLTEQVVHADTFIWWSQLKWRMPLKQASEREIAAVDVDICGSTINYGFESVLRGLHRI